MVAAGIVGISAPSVSPWEVVEFSAGNPRAEIISGNMHPWILKPALHPKSCTLNPRPQDLNPGPLTLDPKPQTPNPKP
jgi:hypothetical protein